MRRRRKPTVIVEREADLVLLMSWALGVEKTRGGGPLVDEPRPTRKEGPTKR